MASDKHYYQILVNLPRNKDQLIFWIRNEKINYNNKDELITFVKNNLKVLKNYRHLTSIYVMEVNKAHFDDIESWYIKNSKPKEYIVINDTN